MRIGTWSDSHGHRSVEPWWCHCENLCDGKMAENTATGEAASARRTAARVEIFDCPRRFMPVVRSKRAAVVW